MYSNALLSDGVKKEYNCLQDQNPSIFNKKMDKKGIAKMVGYKGPELTSSSSQNYNYLQSNYRWALAENMFWKLKICKN